jgi:hypothetical protein
MVVALGLIVGFYYIRRHNRWKKLKSQKSSALNKGKHPHKKGNHTKLDHYARSKETFIPILGRKREPNKKKVSPQPNLNRTASILLHPHSIEQAKLQYLECASSFHGLYEPLYLACQGKMKETAQIDLFKNWEHRIKMTQSQHLELVWRSSAYSRVAAKTSSSENVFRIWLKYLKGWGLQRSLEAGQVCWSLNGNILEECTQESENSI